MARSKRLSSVVRNAQVRVASIQAIDPGLDLGNGLTLAAYQAKVAEVQERLNAYNYEAVGTGCASQ